MMTDGFKADTGKARWDLLPWGMVEGIVKVLTYGVTKYKDRAPDNWRRVENGRERYYAAFLRHFTAWRQGEAIDPESRLPHLWHAATNLLFVYELDEEANLDSPIPFVLRVPECERAVGPGIRK